MEKERRFSFVAWLIFAVALAAVLCLGSSAFGQIDNVGLSYSPEYRWHGLNLYEENIIHSTVNAGIRGFDVSAVSHFDNEDNDLKKWDTSVGYQLPFESLIIRPGYGYMLLPGGIDAQELSVTVGLPGTLSPRYSISHVMPDLGGTEGQIHTIGFDWNIGETMDPNAVTANLSVEACYFDNINPVGGADIQDWTHTTAMLNVNLPMGKQILRPGVIWQHTFEDAISDDDNEVWYTLSIIRRF